MEIESRPWSREEQTELPEPIKVRFSGRLRVRIAERVGDYANAYSDGPSEDVDVFYASLYRPYSRQKTNLVIETEEEAWSVLRGMTHYADGNGIAWMNGSMISAAQRVFNEINAALDEMEIDIERPERFKGL